MSSYTDNIYGNNLYLTGTLEAGNLEAAGVVSCSKLDAGGNNDPGFICAGDGTANGGFPANKAGMIIYANNTDQAGGGAEANNRLGFFGGDGAAQPAKISKPTASPAVGYVQTEVVALFTALNEVIDGLTAFGLFKAA